jgi:hypothetical protein
MPEQLHQHNREQDSANYSEHDFSGSHDAVIGVFDDAATSREGWRSKMTAHVFFDCQTANDSASMSSAILNGRQEVKCHSTTKNIARPRSNDCLIFL